MIRINLLPKPKRPSVWPRVEHVFLAAAGLFFLLSVAVLAINNYQIWELDIQVAQIAQKQALLAPSTARMAMVGEKQRELNSKTGLLLKLTDERSSWHAFLCRLGTFMPAGIWLTEAAIKNKDGAISVTFKGRAVAYDDIAGFLQKLEQDEYLRNSVLIKAEKVDSSGGGQFEVVAQVKKL